MEVEKVLCDHPAVLEAAVDGVGDRKWGEVPLAYITLCDGVSATDKEIIDFCRSRLANFKCPKYIEFTSLPKTATGKIRKNVLRNEARSEKTYRSRHKRTAVGRPNWVPFIVAPCFPNYPSNHGSAGNWVLGRKNYLFA